MQSERDQVKNAWIAKKQACRANIKLLPEGLGLLKDKELKELQERFRELDSEYKAMGVSAERAQLMSGTGADRNGLDVSRANNDQLLDKAKEVQEDSTAKLRDGLRVLETTRDQAKMTAAQLEQDREKIKRIDAGLDEVVSELDISKKLITRFVKRLYTDKMIIAFTFLVVVGLAGIIVYASLNPNQKIFNVPDAVKPALPGTDSGTPAASPSPAP
jgi:SNARE protein